MLTCRSRTKGHFIRMKNAEVSSTLNASDLCTGDVQLESQSGYLLL
jgi:hypothetical protein